MADSGFLWVPTPEAGAPIYHKFGKIIAENCMKNERNWFEGGLPTETTLWTQTPGQRPPDRDTPLDRDIPERNMGPSSQIGSDILHPSPLWTEWLKHACEYITIPETSFADGNKNYVKYLGLDSVKKHLHTQNKVTTWSRSELVAWTERRNQNHNLAACVRG